MFRHLQLIFRNAIRNRRRSFLTICSVAASLCLLGVMIALYQAMFLAPPTKEQALRIITRNRVSLTNPMPAAYRHKISQIPGVRAVTISQWFGGVYKDPKYFFARIALEPEYFEQVYPEYKIIEGSIEDFKKERVACILGKDSARKFNLKVGDRMALIGDIFTINPEFTIRAIYDVPADNESMFFNIQYLFDSIPRGQRDQAGWFTLQADSPDSVPRISQAVDDMFRNSPVQTRTESEKAFQVGFLSFFGDVKSFLMSICAAVTFTMLLVTGNTMAMSVRERVREIGVLKTLGYTNGTILGIILGEAAVLSLIGGALGCLMAQGITYIFHSMPAFIAEFKTLTIIPPVAALLLVVAVLIGLVGSLMPAWQASRTGIIDALRYTG